MTDTIPALFTADVLDATVADAGLAAAITAALARADAEGWVERIHDRDASLWSADAATQAAISGRLGWLDTPGDFADQAPALEAFGEKVRDDGFTSALLLGMGGSSLAATALAGVFGDIDDWLGVRVLDSTDPAAVAAAWDGLDPLATLVIVATKSGTTTETLALLADAWKRIEAALRVAGERRESPGELMIAITDPGHAVDAIPHHDAFRELFLNPEEIGGRYAALTQIGLVPASLLGVDIDALLAAGVGMLARTHAPDPAANPAAALGLTLGALAKAGRDKVTFVVDPRIATLTAWLEQLLAESTGKHGVGIVPIAGEPLGALAAYAPDRVFVRLALRDVPAPAEAQATDAALDALAAAGHPVIRIELGDAIDVAAEFVRWEFATAVAGAVLGVNPFDEPDVAAVKERTAALLAAWERDHPLPVSQPLAFGDGLTLYGDAALALTAGDGTVTGELRRHLARIRPTFFAALTAFIAPTPAREAALTRIRTLLRDTTTRATTAGFGPRYLHATGQLHKGGAPIGWFLQLTADHPADLPIPGRPYSFGTLIDAQAAADFEALAGKDLPILRVHLGADADAGLAALEQALRAASS